MEGEVFLKQKFNLHISPEVVSAAKRGERRNDRKVGEKPKERISSYLGRFEELLQREDPEERERGIRAFKKVFFEKNIIKKENIPERVYQLEQEIAFNLGHGDIPITNEYRSRKSQEIISGQERTLSAWIDYLASRDAIYPIWAKYWALRSIFKVGKYNKEKKSFDKRGKESVAPFPPMNPAAVAKAIAIVQDKIRGGKIENFSHLSEDEFEKAIASEDFSKYYALALESLPEFSEEGLENIKGEWIRYEQVTGSRREYPKQYPNQVQGLFDSLQGYPLEWCTAQNIDTAYGQLKGGDFYVYYSEDAFGNNKIPRVAIRMECDHIAEVRGIESGQEMDKYILPVVEEKMNEFGEEGKLYQKRSRDMKRLTDIYARSFDVSDKTGKKNKKYLNPDLSVDELVFLYEIEASIEGFGYLHTDPENKDPRIGEILQYRNLNSDVGRMIAQVEDVSDLDFYGTKWDDFEDVAERHRSISYNQVAGWGKKRIYERRRRGEGRSPRTDLMEKILRGSPIDRWNDIAEYFEPSSELLSAIVANDGGIEYAIKHWGAVGVGDFRDFLSSFICESGKCKGNEWKFMESVCDGGALLSTIVRKIGSMGLLEIFLENNAHYSLLESLLKNLKNEVIKSPKDLIVLFLKCQGNRNIKILMQFLQDNGVYPEMLDSNEIVNSLIDARAFYIPFKFLKNINEETALRFIEQRDVYDVKAAFEYHGDSFIGLSERTIRALWKKGIETPYVRYPFFQHLGEEIALEIIQRERDGGLNTVFRSISEYKDDVDQNKLLLTVISKGVKPNVLIEYIKPLDRLSKEMKDYFSYLIPRK